MMDNKQEYLLKDWIEEVKQASIQNRHWASDIVVGSLLGHFVTKSVWKNSQAKNREAAVLY